MPGMFFHVEERRAWIRTQTHTVIYDRDPDFLYFSKDPSGTVKRMIRIWLAEPGGEKPHLRAYLLKLPRLHLIFRGVFGSSSIAKS